MTFAPDAGKKWAIPGHARAARPGETPQSMISTAKINGSIDLLAHVRITLLNGVRFSVSQSLLDSAIAQGIQAVKGWRFRLMNPCRIISMKAHCSSNAPVATVLI